MDTNKDVVVTLNKAKKRFALFFYGDMTEERIKAVQALYDALGIPATGKETIAWLQRELGNAT